MDFGSFELGQNTLDELDGLSKTPLSSKKSKESDDEIVEESPNAHSDKIRCLTQASLHERLKNATLKRTKLQREKSQQHTTFKTPELSFEISSISKYLKPELIDFSAWEKSAAKLISPGVFNSSTKPEKSLAVNALDTFSEEDLLDCAIPEESFQTTVRVDQTENSSFNLDGVIFDEEDELKEKLFEEARRSQQSFMASSQAFDSVIRELNVSVQPRHDYSLIVDTTKDLRSIANWNLPQSVVNEYHRKNVQEMFEWQSDCLKNPKVLFEGSNLVYSAPTSAGKTLVSEILMIKSIVERKKKALFILPFVSVVREKMFYLQDLMASSGMRVEGFFGGYHPAGGFESIDLAVCTIEKANGIVNRLLEQDKLSDIGIIVIDEIHLISDSSRGYILEMLLTKVLYISEKFNHKIQIVTMSATLPNVELLCKWLHAEFYYTDFRPVELREMIKIGKNIFDHEMNLIRAVEQKFSSFFPTDTDDVCELVMETILENCQLIVFCPSKDWCEKLCRNLAMGIFTMLKENAPDIKDVLNAERIGNLLEQIRGLPSGADQFLQKYLNYGCAFHHAGLTTDERDIVEMGFKDGTIKVLVATSTLSSGVNLPARRVIIRTPMFNRGIMSNLTYRQMIGRAGRKGKDILGESILVCNNETAKMGKLLIEAPLAPVSSCLDSNNHANLKRMILEFIASGFGRTKTDLENFVNSTLYCQQHNITFNYLKRGNDDLKAILESETRKVAKAMGEHDEHDKGKDPVENVMDYLLHYEFVRLHFDDENNEIQFVPTRLGLACLSSSMSPREGFLLFSELQKAMKNFVLESELHAVYLVTPASATNYLENIDWHLFSILYSDLPDDLRRVGEIVGIKESYLIKAARGVQGNDWQARQVHKRFYAALALHELINEKSIDEVSPKYKINRGQLQTLQQQAAQMAGLVTTFCKSLQYNLLALILAQFSERLFFGIHPDLIDLMKIPSMSSTRIARALHKNNIDKLTALANCKTLTVENILMDLGNNFFVSGKSLGMTVQDIAKLLIKDARNFVQNEIGMNQVKWSQEEETNVEPAKTRESLQEQSFQASVMSTPKSAEFQLNQQKLRDRVNSIARKRKSEPLPASPTEDENKSSKKRKPAIDDNSNISYRKKLRSSDNNDDLTSNNTSKESTDENASLFLRNQTVDESKSILELTQNHLKIIDVLADEKIFNQLKQEVGEQTEIAMSIGVQKIQLKSLTIGGNLLRKERTKHNFTYDDNFIIDCISFCYNSNRICYLNLQTANASMIEQVKKFLFELMSRSDLTLNIYEARDQLKILQMALGLKKVDVKIQDPRVCCWLLDPDANLDWNQMIEKFSPEHLEILELAMAHKSTKSLGLNYISNVEPKIRTAIESFLTNALIKSLIEAMTPDGLNRILANLEMPIQLLLLKMESTGIPIDGKKLRNMVEEAVKLQRQLELHIFKVNGAKFNISSKEEVAKVVGLHQIRGKGKLSTAKNVLEKLDLPIANLIMNWRTLSKTIGNLQPLANLVKNSRIYGTSFSLTASGRISMYEPNLQNVTKDFVVELEDRNELISFRSVFSCQKGKILMSADFSQLELRILSHLCKDENLTRIMRLKGADIFKKIAADWNKIDEQLVTTEQRNQTKELIYAIIYGMGKKALAEKLKIDEQTSAELAEKFHKTYPKIKLYNDKTIQNARRQEYMETMVGRRRYFPEINSKSSSQRSQAERQVFNFLVQGSASDVVKNAMLRMDRRLKSQNINGCELVLHIHDELLYEVSVEKLEAAAKALISSMENVVKLSIPLPVKLKTGTNWGEMKDFNVNP